MELVNNFGISSILADCYIKVRSVNGSKNEVVADIEILSEKDGREYTRMTALFHPDMNGENFIAQAYAHLKTLPEFANAVDC